MASDRNRRALSYGRQQLLSLAHLSVPTVRRGLASTRPPLHLHISIAIRLAVVLRLRLGTRCRRRCCLTISCRRCPTDGALSCHRGRTLHSSDPIAGAQQPFLNGIARERQQYPSSAYQLPQALHSSLHLNLQRSYFVLDRPATGEDDSQQRNDAINCSHDSPQRLSSALHE